MLFFVLCAVSVAGEGEAGTGPEVKGRLMTMDIMAEGDASAWEWDGKNTHKILHVPRDACCRSQS